jgi:hypothetical protein
VVALTRLSSKRLEWFVNLPSSVALARTGPPPVPSPHRQHRLDASERTTVVLAYVGGDSMAVLARTYGVRRETISRILRECCVTATCHPRGLGLVTLVFLDPANYPSRNFVRVALCNVLQKWQHSGHLIIVICVASGQVEQAIYLTFG